MPRFRTISLVSAVLFAAMPLAGCGGGGSGSSSTASGTTAASTGTSSTSSTSAAAPSAGVISLSGTEYAAHANAICKATRAQTAPLLAQVQAETLAAVKSESAKGKPTESIAPLLALVKRLHDSAGLTLFKLKALKPPASAKAAVDSFVGPLIEAIGGLEKAALGMEHGQSAQAVSSLFALQAATPALAKAAKAAGLGECGGILSAAG